MKALDIIEQIEKEFNIKLEKVNYCYPGSKSYVVNPQGKISQLALHDCKIRDIQILSNLKALTSLFLWKNEITNLNPLSGLTELTTLLLTENKIRDISPLRNLKKLTILKLKRNQVTDISIVKDLKELILLELSQNQIIDITPLRELKRLNELSIAFNPITSLPAWIMEFQLEFEWQPYDSHAGRITLYNNPLTDPPVSIVEKGRKRLEDYFKRNQPLRGFISYSKLDGEIKEDGRDYLSDFKKTMYPLIHQKQLLSTWDDTVIIAGEDWDDSIKTGLISADVVFVLVSKNLISTNYIQETELRIAMERQTKGECLVIPIIIKSCPWTDIDFFRDKQCIPRKGFTIASFAKNNEWETIDDAWEHVYDEVKKSLQEFKSKRNTVYT